MEGVISMVWATVITDASFCGITKHAGWAAWIRIDGKSDPVKRYGSFKASVETSTDAEKMAAINGAFIAKSYGADAALIQSDCLAVIHLLGGVTKKVSVISDWNCMKDKAGLSDFHMIGKHVKGHTNVQDARSYVNRWCDKHANIGRMELMQ